MLRILGRDDYGTRNAVVVLGNIGQRSNEMQKDIYICFGDYTEAFDMIEHSKMMYFLDDHWLDDKDLRLIQTLYYLQSVAIGINSKLSEMVPIKRWCSTRMHSFTRSLFSLYSEIHTRFLEDLKGVSIG